MGGKALKTGDFIELFDSGTDFALGRAYAADVAR
jgi:hypothetical protein